MPKIWYPGKFLAQLLPDQIETLYNLFRIQDELLEHKFPYDYIAIHEYLISCAGDIYREMTHRYPHYEYIEEKWSSLQKYCFRRGGLTSGDFAKLKELLQESFYRPQRDLYLKNLEELKAETTKAEIEDTRKKVMLASLDMIRALIAWFESLNPDELPREALNSLTDSIAEYSPKQFYAERY